MIPSILLAGCAVNGSHQQLGKAPESATKEIIAYEGYTGEYPGFTLEVDDRFDEFNADFWQKGDGAVGTESACRFQPQGVQVSNGMLELLVQEEEVDAGWSIDHQKMKTAYAYTCGELRTRDDKKFLYGRMETRMKAPSRDAASGYILSLFTYINDHDGSNNPQNRNFWEEIDIELEGGRPDKIQANLIYGLNTWSWADTRDFGAWEDKIEVGPVDQWRVFAIEWLPEKILWYVDGKLVKTMLQGDIDCSSKCQPPQKYPASIPVNPTQVMMNFWIPNDGIQNVFGGNKANNEYPMRAQYDWFRFYSLDRS